MELLEVLVNFYDSYGLIGGILISVILLFFCRNVTVFISVGDKKYESNKPK